MDSAGCLGAHASGGNLRTGRPLRRAAGSTMGPGFPEEPADPPLGHGIKSGRVEGLPRRRAVPEHDALVPGLPVRDVKPQKEAAPRSPPAGQTARLHPGGLAQRTAPRRHRIDEEGPPRRMGVPRRPRGLTGTEGGYQAIPGFFRGLKGSFSIRPRRFPPASVDPHGRP